MVTLDNFYEASLGLWQEVSRVPDGYTVLRQSGDSSYYLSPCKCYLVRRSNHWGSGIARCNWYLAGYPRNNAFRWRNGVRMGRIALADLMDIRLPDER